MEDLCFLTIAEAGRLFRQRTLSPVELTKAHLDRIDALDPTYHAYLVVTRDRALAAARQAEAAFNEGSDRGPLHGIPVAVKDLMHVAGLRTTAASSMLAESPPATRDATAVNRLEAAGAVLLGKLNLHEFAYGGPGPDAAFPPARNPWNRDYSPGGSSSGSGAATALGLAMGTLGTDTGGSIRMPASSCGVVGLKPTFGLVSRAGVIPLSWSLDHVGPLVRSVEDAGLMLDAIGGPDPGDPWSAGTGMAPWRAGLVGDIRGLRVGVPQDPFFDPGQVHPEVRAAVEEAIETLRGLGAVVTEVTVPHLGYDYAAGAVILAAEAYTYHASGLRDFPERYAANVRNRFRSGAFVRARDYLRAQQMRTLLKREFGQVLRQVDVLVTPAMPQPPARLGEPPSPEGVITGPMLLRPFNMAGLPGISVPCGFSSNGLPLGLHIAGRPFDEATVLRAARAYETATDWHTRRPPEQKETA